MATEDHGEGRERLRRNPFYVLELRPGCSRAEVERQGQKLLGMLELGLSAARTYPTPLGRVEREADAVRQAMAELRDPDRRLLHELWAHLDPALCPEAEAAPGAETLEDRLAPWPAALRALGLAPEGG